MKNDEPALLGPGRHTLTLHQVRVHFVDSFTDQARLHRFERYVALFSLVRRLEVRGIIAEVWVDGSFLTEKPEPEDVDLSIMVDSDVYDGLGEDAQELIDEIAFAEGRYLRHLDAFVCIVYPRGDRRRAMDPPEDWARLWGIEHNERYLKGFVVVKVG